MDTAHEITDLDIIRAGGDPDSPDGGCDNGRHSTHIACWYGRVYAPVRPMPEWRRRSLEGRNRFDAVSNMTDRVAGR